MLKHIPNILTCLRIALVPCFVILFLLGMYTWSGVVFVIAEITDVLDGWIARRFGCISVVGKALDPLADKLTLIGILLCLYIARRVPLWLLVLLILRESAMIAGGVVLWRNRLTFGSDRYGKITSTLFFAAAVLLLPWHDVTALLYTGYTLLLLSLVSSLMAFIHYFRRYLDAVSAKHVRAK